MKVVAPFDGQKALWMWEFSQQAEQSWSDVAGTALTLAGCSTVLVKLMDGSAWMNNYDPHAPAGMSDWQAAQAEASRAGVALLPWVVPQTAADAAAHALLGPVLVCDVEPYAGFWSDPAQAIPNYLATLQAGGVAHCYVSIDPRPSAISAVNFAAWAGSVAGILPQLYWTDFQQDALEVLPMLRQVMAARVPVYPVLPGNGDAQDLQDVWRLAQTLGCRGLSAWRLGSMDRNALAAVKALTLESGVDGTTRALAWRAVTAGKILAGQIEAAHADIHALEASLRP